MGQDEVDRQTVHINKGMDGTGWSRQANCTYQQGDGWDRMEQTGKLYISTRGWMGQDEVDRQTVHINKEMDGTGWSRQANCTYQQVRGWMGQDGVDRQTVHKYEDGWDRMK